MACALFVDGPPYLQANTVSVPIAWEQIERTPDNFDFSFLDVLLTQAREQNVRLILLWFATWKNNAQNEAGTYGSVRDYSPAAEKLFRSAVPEVLLRKFQRRPGNWKQVFGADADEYFHAWSVARYIGEIAAAGKAEYPLPQLLRVKLATY